MKIRYFYLLFFAFLILHGCSPSNESASNSFIYNKDGIAMEGYDLVAYIMDNDAIKGKAENKIRYQDVDFYFTRPSYRDEFLQHPEKYLPAYGGYCALTVAQESERAGSDPTLWILQDGQLLFFSDSGDQSGRNKAEWVVKRKQLKKQADENWGGM